MIFGYVCVCVCVRAGDTSSTLIASSLEYYKTEETDMNTNTSPIFTLAHTQMVTCNILSGEGSIPGTMCAGEKASCSTSAK